METKKLGKINSVEIEIKRIEESWEGKVMWNKKC